MGAVAGLGSGVDFGAEGGFGAELDFEAEVDFVAEVDLGESGVLKPSRGPLLGLDVVDSVWVLPGE